MKRLSVVAVVSFLAALMAPAFAGERYLGTVTVSDGGYTANARQTDAGFYIPVGAKISVQPTGHAYVCVDSQVGNAGALNCSTSSGVLVPAGTLFASSCSKTSSQPIVPEIVLLSDAGYAAWDAGRFGPTCTVACIAMDAGTVNCNVWERAGDEI